jgi:hypothetical protein
MWCSGVVWSGKEEEEEGHKEGVKEVWEEEGGGREGKVDGLVVLILMERRKEIGHLACSCSQPVPQSVSQSVSQSVDQRSVGRFGECKEKRSE